MSTPKASEREKQLETDLKEASDRRDEYKAQLDTVTGERDEAVAQREQATTELHAVTAERDETTIQRDNYQQDFVQVKAALDTLREQYEALSEQFEESQRQLVERIAGTVLSTEPTEESAAQEPSEEEKIKDLLKRNGLKKCWMLPSGPCFSEQHAREYAGEEFDSLTVISVEADAGTN